MKALYLEPDEEITSVVDRLRDIDDAEVAVVIPKRAGLLQSIINLKLLRYQAEQQQKKISVVTTDKTGRNLASAVGLTVHQRLPEGTDGSRESAVKERAVAAIPIKFKRTKPEAPPKPAGTGPTREDIGFKSGAEPELKKRAIPDPAPAPRAAPSNAEPEPKPVPAPEPADLKQGVKFEAPREAAEQPAPAKRTFSKFSLPKPTVPKPRLRLRFRKMGGLTTVAIILVLLLGAGTAAAVILPKATVQVTPKTDPLSTDVPVTFSARQPALDPEGNVVPAKVIEVTKQTSKEVNATGTKSGGEKARGDITVANTLNRNQSLVARTRFQAPNGRIFRSQSGVVVPAGGSATVSVLADEGGPEGNLPAGTRLTIPGLRGSSAVYGQVDTPLTGGSPGEGATEVSQADVDRAKAELSQQAAQEGLAEARGKLAVGYQLNPQVAGATVLSSETNPRAGATASKFTITGTVKVSYFTYQEEDLRKLLGEDLKGKVPPGSEVVEESGRETYVVNQTSADRLVGTMQIRTFTAPDVSREQIKQDIAGKSPAEAEAALLSSGRASAVEIRLSPFWVKDVPGSLDKIDIRFTAGAGASPSPSPVMPTPGEQTGSPPPVL